MTRFVPVRVLAMALVSACVALPATSAYASPPPPPTLTAPVDQAQTVQSSVTIACTGADPNAHISVYVNGSHTGGFDGQANGSGNCSFPYSIATLANGDYSISITQTNGLESAQSNSVTLQARPQSPVITYPTNNGPLQSLFMFVQGAEGFANGTVVVTVDGTPHTVTASASGGWKYDITGPLAQGIHTVSAHNVDAGSNAGPDTSPAQTFFYLPAPTLTGPNGWINPALAGGVNLSYSGVEPFAKVRVYDVTNSPTLMVTATADANGNGTASVPGFVSDGVHSYAAKQEDVSHPGHFSDLSAAANAYVDTQAPPTPAQLLPNFGLPAEWSDGDLINNPTQIFVYSTEDNSVPRAPVWMHWTLDGVSQGPIQAIGDGTAQVMPSTPFSEGPHTIVVTAVDEAGNASAGSATTNFVVDSIAPSEIKLVSPAEISSDASGVLQLKTEPLATVTISLDGGPILHDTADNLGNVEFDVGPLADGDHAIDATATDAAGNGGRLTLNFTTDTTPPQAPIISSPAPNAVVTVHRPAIVFAGDPNTDNAIVIDGAPVGNASTDGDGNASFTVPSDLADGPHIVSVTAIDAAQNSTDSIPVAFTVAEPPPTNDPPPDDPSHTPRATPLTLSGVKLSGGVLQTCKRHARRCHARTAKLTLSVSAPATIKLVLTHSVHHHTKVAATVTVKAPKAGKVSYVLHRKVGGHTLPRGSYKLVIQATAKADGSQSATVTKSIRVR